MGGACHKKHGPRLECGLGDRYRARVIFHVWLAWTLMLRTPGARMNSGSSAFAPRATPPPLRASSNMAGAGPQICFVGKVDGWVAARRILDTDSDTDTDTECQAPFTHDDADTAHMEIAIIIGQYCSYIMKHIITMLRKSTETQPECEIHHSSSFRAPSFPRHCVARRESGNPRRLIS